MTAYSNFRRGLDLLGSGQKTKEYYYDGKKAHQENQLEASSY